MHRPRARGELRANGRVEQTLVAVGEAEGAVDGQRRVVGEATQRLRELAATAATVQQTSSSRVVELYKRDWRIRRCRACSWSSSTEQAIGRAQVLNIVEHNDREALEEVVASRTAVDAQRDLLEQQQQSYERALRDR